ncbi:MAG: phosphate/phosphite/phosphonate ABC transporter substrate-binding protein, partial [Rhodospirillales bacterium]
MDLSSYLRRSFIAGIAGLAAVTFVVGAAGAAAECKSRGDLDVRYCDEDGDLVADTPTDPGKWLDPDTLI